MKKLLTFLLLFVALIVPAKAFEIATQIQGVWYQHEEQYSNGFYNLDSHVTIQSQPKQGWGYYAMSWFWFTADAGGYMGLQQGPEGSGKRMAIFSIWDKVPGNVKSIPLMNWCRRFDHEGFGAQCIIDYAWKPNTEYKLRIWMLSNQDDNRGIKWGGWVIDTTTGQETLIGVILVENYQNSVGYGLLANYGHVHITEFWAGDRNATCYTVPDFNVTWKGPYGNNGTANPVSAKPSYSTGVGTDCPNKQMTSDAPFSTTMTFGPTVQPVTGQARYENLYSKWVKSDYDRADCVFDWAERMFPGEFNQSKFHHRRLSNYSQAANTYYRDYRLNNTGYTLGYDMSNQDMVITDSAGITYNVGDISGYITAASCSGVVR